ncbi:hypothetical protein RHSIM_Rhsim01G0253100 [Rhododendron simsii]|uniref:Uncharacterized protein n=1 Tax=Rhododendron simsii TaxID=118357 RepID=A0A834HPC1_RHOSS|nr:hypothetical protein RHSIM_Rhsim01G0253100 [Rhododendron simsii]
MLHYKDVATYLHLLLTTFALILSRLERYYAYKRLLGLNLLEMDMIASFSGGQAGTTRYSIIFAVVGTMVDFATLKLKHALKSFRESMAGNNDGSPNQNGGLKLPEWSPIQILDEEALAAKKAREQLYAQRNVHNLTKEES